MSSSKHSRTGIHSTIGLRGVRATLRPWSQAAVGLASALAASGALAQEAAPSAAASEQPAAVQAPASTEPAQQAATQQAPAQQAPAAPEQQKPAEEPQFVLPTVHVEAEADPYRTEEASLARVPKAVVNTPQTITMVPQKVIREQNATTLRDALRNVSGITVSAGEGGRQGDTFNLRGFSAQTDTARDGARDLGWFTRDTFNVEGVEVYFGPSSVLFGRGSTGGAINLVTKKPKKTSFQELRLTGGTAPSGRIEADLNEVLSDTVQVRINAMGQLANVAGRDLASENRAGVAPSARFQLGENTALELDYLFQREDSVPDYGHPYFNSYPVSITAGVDRNVFYGVQDSDTERVDAHVASARFLTRFSAFQLSNTLRYGRVDRFARPTAPRGLTPATAPTSIGRQRFETETDNTYLTNQTDVRGGFATGLLKHSVNVGLELSREQREQQRNNLNAIGLSSGPNVPADLFEPSATPDLSAVSPVFQSASDSAQWSVAVYAADQVEITQYLELLASARVDIFNTNYTAEDAARKVTTLENRDTLFNWRAGLVLHPVEKTSLYAMYGTSANPSAEGATLANDTATLDPERNAIIEVGGKAELLEGLLGVNASVFRMEKTNARVPNTNPEGPPQVLEGEQRMQGFNIGIVGTLARGWQTTANYTLMDSAILKHSNPYLVGQRLPNAPKHSLSLWTTYGITEALTVGGGATFQDVTAVNNPTSTAQVLNKVPNYWRFDAVATYAWSRAELQLNVYNLTNALYYEQYLGGHAVPAKGVSAALSGKVRF
ncbi:TonB-dependent siderophore receptor [Myxococcaceae bacterium GXIMD 01537]